jgi:hypothetical protein
MAKQIETKSLFTPEEYKESFKKNKKSKAEEAIQLEVCAYIKAMYPNVIFMCDLSSGMKLPIWLAARNAKMRSSRGLPDLFIAESRGGYSGVFLELKKDGIRLKNGDMPSSEHIKEQEEILHNLRMRRYAAEFACGFDEAKVLIDSYLSR